MAFETITTLKTSGPSFEFGHSRVGTIEMVLDCAVNNVPSGDTVQLFDVAAGQKVLALAAEVITEEGDTLTVGIGDGADPDGYLDGLDCDTAGMTDMALELSGDAGAAVRYTAGKLYTAADTVDMMFNNAADAAKIRVIAVVADLS